MSRCGGPPGGLLSSPPTPGTTSFPPHSQSLLSSEASHGQSQSMTGNSVSMSGTQRSRSAREREDKRSVHIKKPLNAFMLYMKEMRPKIVAECTLKESAAINQILGRRVRYEIRIFFSYPFNLLYFSGTALAGKNKPSITNKRVRNANYICKCILVGQPETIMLKVRRKNGNESQKQHQVGC